MLRACAYSRNEDRLSERNDYLKTSMIALWYGPLGLGMRNRSWKTWRPMRQFMTTDMA